MFITYISLRRKEPLPLCNACIKTADLSKHGEQLVVYEVCERCTGLEKELRKTNHVEEVTPLHSDSGGYKVAQIGQKAVSFSFCPHITAYSNLNFYVVVLLKSYLGISRMLL